MNVIEPMDVRHCEHREAQADHAPFTPDPILSTDGAPRISLKQWRFFHAVIDNDGFVGAANKLHISQSSISHALAKLQEHLGVQLLVIRGRKAHITEEGKAVLARSRELVKQAVQLEELGNAFRLGWEPEVRLAVEPNYPADLLMKAFRDLGKLSRKVRLDVKEVNRTELAHLLHQDEVDLAISTATLRGFASSKLIEIEHVAIAHADSPLFRMNRGITFADLDTCFEIVFYAGGHDAAPHNPGRAGQSQRAWRVNSLDSVAEALQVVPGYAWLPRYRVQRWLEEGWARILPLNSGSSSTIQMHLIRGRTVVPGSGAQTFADALEAVASEHAGWPGSRASCGHHPGAPVQSARPRPSP